MAYHTVFNKIVVCPVWFDKTWEDQVTVLLHEMFHWTFYQMQDRESPYCKWNGGHTCYQDFLNGAEWFVGGNPRALVDAWEFLATGPKEMDMLFNIDNYESWIWNRYADRGICILKYAI